VVYCEQYNVRRTEETVLILNLVRSAKLQHIQSRTYSNYGDECFAAEGLKLRNSHDPQPSTLCATLLTLTFSFNDLSGYSDISSVAEIAAHCD